MERLIQVLDDVDDLYAALRHRFGWWPAAKPLLRAMARGRSGAHTEPQPLKSAR